MLSPVFDFTRWSTTFVRISRCLYRKGTVTKLFRRGSYSIDVGRERKTDRRPQGYISGYSRESRVLSL
ncbi:hypothetical protein L218DRAFT_966284 [Marasmius fiardii PR-910]|nr:hypothetical protein L218DRAFT_966284 [Marasmius fiardii PR-910]